MIPLDQARAFVLASCPPLAPVELPIEKCLGAVCAEDVIASDPVPPFDNSAMDGFALRHQDTEGAPVELEVVGTVAAGSAMQNPIGPGEAVRIMTGAPIPPGADAVVMVEHTRAAAGRDGSEAVRIAEPAAAGDNVRLAGSDLARGDLVLAHGTVLAPGHLGVLASTGKSSLKVFPSPRVGVLSTGDELVAPDAPLAFGQIRDSNRIALLASLSASGFEPIDLGSAPDDPIEIESALVGAAEVCDAVITSGGVSVGDFDHTKAVLDRLGGGTMRWMQVAIKPAKPFAFGLISTVPVFALPGNPVSSLVSFECFARPALRQMAGHSQLLREEISAVADEALSRRSDGKLHFARVVASVPGDGAYHVRSAGGQGSHQLGAMAAANALALLPDGEGVKEGETVRIWLLRPSS